MVSFLILDFIIISTHQVHFNRISFYLLKSRRDIHGISVGYSNQDIRIFRIYCAGFSSPEGYIPSGGNGDIPRMSIGCPRTFEDYFGISQHPVRISSGRPRDILLLWGVILVCCNRGVSTSTSFDSKSVFRRYSSLNSVSVKSNGSCTSRNSFRSSLCRRTSKSIRSFAR